MRDLIFATRRQFLGRGITILSALPTMPVFLSRLACAVAQQPPDRDGRVLVVIQLAGGNDGLNCVVPFADDNYHRLRPRLAVPAKDAIRINDSVALNPKLKEFASLLDAGSLTIVQGVGYPNPNRSHFKSTDIWSTGDPTGRYKTGWLGRYFDNCCKGQPHPQRDLGISLSNDLPLAMKGGRYSATTFAQPHLYQWLNPRNDPSALAAFKAFNHAPDDSEPPTLQFLRRTALDAQVSSEQLRRVAAGGRTDGYPGHPFANHLAMVARMIAGDLPTRIYYVSLGGFDTHANQRWQHENLLSILSQSMAAFLADLKRLGQADRVLAMSFSEFGRRVAENASGGTDHGTAAPMFLFGRALKAGLVGVHPSLQNLPGGDLNHTIDFRSVYASILRQWLGVSPQSVLGRPFKTLKIT